MSEVYEIEIKTLLGNEDNANSFRNQILEKKGELLSKNKQLNHYFILGDIQKFKEKIGELILEENKERFEKILEKGDGFSVRSREVDEKVILVIKATAGKDESANGVVRMEFEQEVDMSLDELDQKLLDSGLEYQAKWSREREEYKINDISICLDKNAGYGYLAEFESVVDTDETLADASSGVTKHEEVKSEIYSLMKEFGIEELQQDRLARMFDYYNKNWEKYYGTDNIFVIE
jgi:adenylate cyclase class IV